MTAVLDRTKIIVAVMTETDLERICRYLFRQRGLLGYHVIDSRRNVTIRGWPDWSIVGSRVLFRELKTERGRLTADQADVGQAILRAGGDWAIWRPADLKSGLIETELDDITERTSPMTDTSRPKFKSVREQAAELAAYAASHGQEAAREKLSTLPAGLRSKIWRLAFSTRTSPGEHSGQ